MGSKLWDRDYHEGNLLWSTIEINICGRKNDAILSKTFGYVGLEFIFHEREPWILGSTGVILRSTFWPSNFLCWSLNLQWEYLKSEFEEARKATWGHGVLVSPHQDRSIGKIRDMRSDWHIQHVPWPCLTTDTDEASNMVLCTGASIKMSSIVSLMNS